MDPLIIPIVAILMPLVLVPTILTLKHRHKRREWEHLEKMRAMNGPHPLTQLGGWAGTGAVAAIGGGVPMVAVMGALVTSLNWDPMTPGDSSVPAIAWGSAVLISAGGLFTSYILAHLQARTQRQIDSAAVAERHAEKPAFDPDTFDVVGSRG